jgi:hypothetical protein
VRGLRARWAARDAANRTRDQYRPLVEAMPELVADLVKEAAHRAWSAALGSGRTLREILAATLAGIRPGLLEVLAVLTADAADVADRLAAARRGTPPPDPLAPLRAALLTVAPAHGPTAAG